MLRRLGNNILHRSGRLTYTAVAATAVVWLAVAGNVGAAPPDRTARDVDVDQPMYLDPVLEAPKPKPVFAPRLRELWLAALQRPDAQTRRRAIEAIIESHQLGMPGWADSIDNLIILFESKEQHPQVRLSLARALVVLDAKRSAPLLLKASQTGSQEMISIVDVALSKWDYKPARQVWIARLRDRVASRTTLLAAVEALANVKDVDSVPVLKALVMDLDANVPLRLGVGEALGTIAMNGLESAARKLIADADAPMTDRLIAARILGGHSSDQARAILQRLADDPTSVVGAVALDRLLKIDPPAVRSRARRLLNSSDVNLRRIAGRALFQQADIASVQMLTPLLNDPDPVLRVKTRQWLEHLSAKPSLTETAIKEVTGQLASDRWRALEQAAFFLAQQKHRPAVPRLLQLLKFDRPEVRMAAIVSLRRLSVGESLDGMLHRAQALKEVALQYRNSISQKHQQLLKIYDLRKKAQARKDNVEVKRLNREAMKIQKTVFPMDPSIEAELAQLFQCFGLMKFKLSDPLLRSFISKEFGLPKEARTAAIWALGHIHAGKPDADLVRLFSGRLSDLSDSNPEYEQVRRMSAVSMGRMKAKSALGILRRFYDDEMLVYYSGGACRWAIIHMTGEQLPPFPLWRDVTERGWFLEPLD